MTELERDVDRLFPFSEYREGQKEAIIDILNSTDRHYVLEAATGIGKSIIGFTVAKYLNYKRNLTGVILTREIFLQEQYRKTFNEIAMIFGKGNFECTFGGTAEEAVCRFMESSSTLPCHGSCSYFTALRVARKSPIIVSNYHYYSLSLDFLQGANIGARDVLIFDEAHKLNEFLVSYNTVKMDDNLIKKINYITIGRGRKILEKHFGPCSLEEFNLKSFLNHVKDKLSKYDSDGDCFKQFYLYYTTFHEELNDQIYNIVRYLQHIFSEELPKKLGIDLSDRSELRLDDLTEYKEILKELGLFQIIDDFKLLRHLNCRLNTIKKTFDSVSKYEFDWIIDFDKDTFSIVPLDSKNFFNNIFSSAKKIIYMSATLNKEIDLCLNGDEGVSFSSLGSSFNPKKAPFVFMPVTNFTQRNRDVALNKITLVIKQLLEKYPNVKGLIHTVSYKNADFIINKLKTNRLVKPALGKERIISIEKFKKVKDNKVLISPSLLEGVDLPEDSARFQIFIKVPYLNLKDKRIRILAKLNPIWYKREAAKMIEQGSGRGIRSIDDEAITYFLDEQFSKIPQTLFSSWFRKRLITVGN